MPYMIVIDFTVLTPQMIYEFVDKIVVHSPVKVDGEREQQVDIYLKFIGRFELPPAELTPEEEKRQATLKRHRITSRERYRMIKAGEHKVGEPFKLTCKNCGKTFESLRSNAMFCGADCRRKFYKKERASKPLLTLRCQFCGSSFKAKRKNTKFCSESCRHAANNLKRKNLKESEKQKSA